MDTNSRKRKRQTWRASLTVSGDYVLRDLIKMGVVTKYFSPHFVRLSKNPPSENPGSVPGVVTVPTNIKEGGGTGVVIILT